MNLRDLLLCAVGACLAVGVAPAADKVDFNRDIRPILSDRCFACHGPEEKSRQAGLRLDDKNVAFAELESGETAIVAGDASASAIIARITEADESLRMPPPESGKTVSPEELALLKRWIDEGAPWAEHWSFIPPVKHDPPQVKNGAWIKNDIDRFILARLEAEGLSPSKEADKATLIRRVSLDLTGLPPTHEEIDAFVKDASPDAYEKLVDRLLASPRYGEHMARYWLDAARYGDTHGLHLDNFREMWPYRDWVIRAFNQNQPYDKFTIEQLAGDLLPNPTMGQLIATGFNRCHVTTSEGGSIEEEVYVRNTNDRVTTTGTVFLGLTFDCTRCHDHKYDPLTQKDFYSLFAFFNSIEGSPLDGNSAKHAPILLVTTPEQEQQIKDLETQIAALKTKLSEPLPEVDAAQAAWESLVREQSAADADWAIIDPHGFTSKGGATLAKLDDQSVLASGENAPKDVYEIVGKLPAGGMTALRLEGLVHESLTNKGHGRSANSNVVMTGFEAENASADEPEEFRPIKFVRAWADHEQSNGDFKIANAIDANPQSGWATAGYEKVENRTAIFVAEAPQGAAGDIVKIRLKFESQFGQHQFGRVRLAATSAKVIPQIDLAVPAEMLDIVKVEAAQRSPEQQTKLRDFYRKTISKDPTVTKAYIDIEAFTKQRDALNNAKPSTLIWKEMAKPRDAFILKRGEYDQRLEKVTRATPAILPPMPEGATATRLGLAQWIVAPENPLTARVAVNRFWQQVFGTGIVKTAEDFGAQGEPPSHADLLDWLAVDFRENGWDTKRLMKQLVMSSTYRQSSKTTPELAQRDPENRLLARGPRFRLDAEVLRDQALAASGLLVEKIGGPGVKPPQPDLWSAVAYVGSNTMNFSKDNGHEKVHRRTLYTFFKRTAPPPQMSTFDAPNRESCRVRRERTNTPLQMLLLMNDPQYVEAARVLAERTMKQGGETPADRVNFMFRLCAARLPTDEERAEMISFFDLNLAEFKAAEGEAARLVTIGEGPPDQALPQTELAAWTLVANLVLCLDEVVTKN